MSDELEVRIQSLENEVNRLRGIVESLSMRDVEGNLVLHLSGASDTSISVGNVGNNMSVENSGELNDLSISTAHVGNNVEVTCADGDVSDVSISTGSVGNSVVSRAEG